VQDGVTDDEKGSSADEIAELDDDSGLVGPDVPHIEIGHRHRWSGDGESFGIRCCRDRPRGNADRVVAPDADRPRADAGVTLCDIVPVEGIEEAVDDIAGSLEHLRRRLQEVDSDAREQPAAAGTALDDAVRMAERLPIRVAALQGIVTRAMPVIDPRGGHG
jgi:hypothetical protein